MFAYGVGFRGVMGVGCPCPPIRNNIWQLDENWDAQAFMCSLTTVKILSFNSNRNMGKKKIVSSKVKKFNFVLSTDIFMFFFKKCEKI